MDGVWELQEINGIEISVADRPKLTVASDGTVSGDTGINRLSGRRDSGGERLFQHFAVTRRAGPPVAMRIESEFLDALSRVVRFEYDASELRLFDDQTVILKFRPSLSPQD